jgi:hypothetical protein
MSCVVITKAERQAGSWPWLEVLLNAQRWFKKTEKRLGAVSEKHAWWGFAHRFRRLVKQWIQSLADGTHRFSPLIQYLGRYGDLQVVWSFLDTLMVHLVHRQIRKTFPHIISKRCLHLAGPNAVKSVTHQITAAMNSGQFQYCIRTDIKSFYASIDRGILLKQLSNEYDDPKLLNYFEGIVNVAIDNGGNVCLPKIGIPLRSSLSPFFGALYLKPLDEAFEKKAGIYYVRYMDDVIILIKNKRQYTKARKVLFSTLRKLKLQVSPKKTWMGKLTRGFHFLGIDYKINEDHQAARTLGEKTQVRLHKRTHRRALDKVIALRSAKSDWRVRDEIGNIQRMGAVCGRASTRACMAGKRLDRANWNE